jgi:hypothetical protein
MPVWTNRRLVAQQMALHCFDRAACQPEPMFVRCIRLAGGGMIV